jgi:hypothetical protein
MTTGRRGHLPPDRHALHLETRPEEEPPRPDERAGGQLAASAVSGTQRSASTPMVPDRYSVLPTSTARLKAGAAAGAVVAAKYFRTGCAVRVWPGVTR